MNPRPFFLISIFNRSIFWFNVDSGIEKSAGRLSLIPVAPLLTPRSTCSGYRAADMRIKTVGLGKSDKAPDGGSVEVLTYPEGTATAQT